MKQVGRLGGSVLTVSRPRGGRSRYAWSRDGTRVAFAVGHDSIFAYAAETAEPELLGVHGVGGWEPHSLAWSPDGRLIAYVNGNPGWPFGTNVANASIWILDANGGEPLPVTDQEHLNVSPQWLPDSRNLLFISNREGQREVYVVEVGPTGPRGEPQKVPGPTDPHSISISADGRRLAYARFPVTGQNIWSIPIPRSGAVSIRDAAPVTTGNQTIESHSLSPDGKWIAFDSDRGGEFDLYKMQLDGGDQELVADIPGIEYTPDWSPDGTEIAFYSGGPVPALDIRVVSANGGTPEPITDYPGQDAWPAWSPDGLTIAYQSADSANGVRWRIWIVSRDGVGLPWGDPVQLTDFPCGPPDWAPEDASLVCGWRGEFVRVSRGGEVQSRYDLSTAGLRSVNSPQFSPDGSRIYFGGTHEDGTDGLWWMPADGGDATKVVAFDDPSVEVKDVTVGPEHLYLTIAKSESDIWVMDLEW